MPTAVAPPSRSPWRAAFERRQPVPGAPAWLDALRREALERLLADGFPGPRDEAWLHSSLAPLERQDFAPSPLAAAPTGCAALDPIDRALPQAARFVFVDGRPAPAPSRALSGVRVRPLVDVLRDEPESLRRPLEESASVAHPLLRLNTAFLGQGLFVEVEPRAQVAAPVLIEHVSTKDVGPLASHLRILVHAGAGSRLQVIESYVGLGAAADFTNASTRVVVEAGAKVRHLRVQREGPGAFHAGLFDARLAADASLETLALVAGAARTRLETSVLLDGPGASCRADALFLVDGSRHADVVSRVEHRSPHATSRQLVKGVLDGEGRGAFTGRVHVAPGAVGTDARQACHSLLLSPRAVIDARPQLEIDAADVKCSHGATTGRLDETALFYLRSRGLGPVEARDLLVHAFAGEVLARLGPDPVRPALDALLAAALHEARSPGRAP